MPKNAYWMSLGHPPPTPSTESQPISPNRMGFLDLKITCFLRNFFNGSLGNTLPLNRYWFTKQSERHWGLPSAVIWKNPDSFEKILKIGSHLERSIQFRNHPENWQSSGKIRTVLKVLGPFKRFFCYIRAKTFRTRKNFPGSNATLLPRFFCLCRVLPARVSATIARKGNPCPLLSSYAPFRHRHW